MPYTWPLSSRIERTSCTTFTRRSPSSAPLMRELHCCTNSFDKAGIVQTTVQAGRDSKSLNTKLAEKQHDAWANKHASHETCDLSASKLPCYSVLQHATDSQTNMHVTAKSKHLNKKSAEVSKALDFKQASAWGRAHLSWCHRHRRLMACTSLAELWTHDLGATYINLRKLFILANHFSKFHNFVIKSCDTCTNLLRYLP